MNIYTNETEYLKTEVQRLSALVRAQQITIDKLEAQLEQEPVAHPFEDKSVISSLSWAAGLIEQAYRASGGHNGADSWLMNYADKQGERIRQADHREWEKVNGRWQVKVTPPQRTWVGLTGKEVMDVTRKEGHELLDFIYEYGTASEGTDERVVAICKAIEAKLKEKNK